MSDRSRIALRLPELPVGTVAPKFIDDAGSHRPWPYTVKQWERIQNSLPVSAADADLEPLLLAARRFVVYQRQNERRPTPDPQAEVERYENALREMELAFENLSSA